MLARGERERGIRLQGGEALISGFKNSDRPVPVLDARFEFTHNSALQLYDIVAIGADLNQLVSI